MVPRHIRIDLALQQIYSANKHTAIDVTGLQATFVNEMQCQPLKGVIHTQRIIMDCALMELTVIILVGDTHSYMVSVNAPTSPPGVQYQKRPLKRSSIQGYGKYSIVGFTNY